MVGLWISPASFKWVDRGQVPSAHMHWALQVWRLLLKTATDSWIAHTSMAVLVLVDSLKDGEDLGYDEERGKLLGGIAVHVSFASDAPLRMLESVRVVESEKRLCNDL